MNIDQASSAEIIRTDQHAVMRLMVLLDAQKRALEMMLEKAPLAEVLAHLAKTVEEQAEGRAVASILLLDAEGALRRGASAWAPHGACRSRRATVACWEHSAPIFASGADLFLKRCSRSRSWRAPLRLRSSENAAKRRGSHPNSTSARWPTTCRSSPG